MIAVIPLVYGLGVLSKHNEQYNWRIKVVPVFRETYLANGTYVSEHIEEYWIARTPQGEIWDQIEPQVTTHWDGTRVGPAKLLIPVKREIRRLDRMEVFKRFPELLKIRHYYYNDWWCLVYYPKYEKAFILPHPWKEDRHNRQHAERWLAAIYR